MIGPRNSLLLLAAIYHYAFIGVEARAYPGNDVQPSRAAEVNSVTARSDDPSPLSATAPSQKTEDASSNGTVPQSMHKNSRNVTVSSNSSSHGGDAAGSQNVNVVTVTRTIQMSVVTFDQYTTLPPMDKGQVDGNMTGGPADIAKVSVTLASAANINTTVLSGTLPSAATGKTNATNKSNNQPSVVGTDSLPSTTNSRIYLNTTAMLSGPASSTGSLESTTKITPVTATTTGTSSTLPESSDASESSASDRSATNQYPWETMISGNHSIHHTNVVAEDMLACRVGICNEMVAPYDSICQAGNSTNSTDAKGAKTFGANRVQKANPHHSNSQPVITATTIPLGTMTMFKTAYASTATTTVTCGVSLPCYPPGYVPQETPTHKPESHALSEATPEDWPESGAPSDESLGNRPASSPFAAAAATNRPAHVNAATQAEGYTAMGVDGPLPTESALSAASVRYTQVAGYTPMGENGPLPAESVLSIGSVLGLQVQTSRKYPETMHGLEATPTQAIPESLSQLPLGSTVVNGTVNSCLIPTGSSNTVVHCWGEGEEAATLTCYEQAVDPTYGEWTDVVESVWAMTYIVTLKESTTISKTVTSLPDYGQPTVVNDPHFPISGELGGHHTYTPSGIRIPVTNAPVPPVEISTTVPVVVLPTGIVIGTDLITEPLQPTQQVVTVNSVVYTVNPSQIIGLGTTYDIPRYGIPNNLIGYRPGIVYGGAPTSGFLDGHSVLVSGATVQVDGTPFSIPPQPSVGVVNGDQTVYLGPDAVVAGGKTMSIAPFVVSAGPDASGNSPGAAGGAGGGVEVVVAGGTVLTLDDTNIIVDGKSIPYNGAAGGLTSSTVLTVAGDAVTIVPAAARTDGGSNGVQGGAFVVVHGTTITAPAAGSTHYELVGGATFTEVSPSVIVLDGHSYTVGPAATGATGGAAAAAATPTTVVVGGETVTIGPGGVTVGGSLTFKYPFMAATTIMMSGMATLVEPTATNTPSVGGLRTGAGPTETQNRPAPGMADSSNGDAASKNGASRPGLSLAVLGVSLTMSLTAAMSFLICFG